MKTKIISLFVVLFTGVCAFGWSVFDQPPRYRVQAEFSVNWKQMGGGDENFNLAKAKENFDHELLNFAPSDEFISKLQDDCKLSEYGAENLLVHLQNYLVIKRIGACKNGALYRIQFTDDNKEMALQVVNSLNHQLVENLNAGVKISHVFNGLSKYNDGEKARNDRASAQKEVNSLEQQQSENYSSERAARIEQLNKRLNESQGDETMANLQTFINVVELFNSPANIVQNGVIKN